MVVFWDQATNYLKALYDNFGQQQRLEKEEKASSGLHSPSTGSDWRRPHDAWVGS